MKAKIVVNRNFSFVYYPAAQTLHIIKTSRFISRKSSTTENKHIQSWASTSSRASLVWAPFKCPHAYAQQWTETVTWSSCLGRWWGVWSQSSSSTPSRSSLGGSPNSAALHQCQHSILLSEDQKYWIIKESWRFCLPFILGDQADLTSEATEAVYSCGSHTWLSEPAVSSTFCAVGCHSTSPTRRWWYTRSTTGSVSVRDRPPSGICHTWIQNKFFRDTEMQMQMF